MHEPWTRRTKGRNERRARGWWSTHLFDVLLDLRCIRAFICLYLKTLIFNRFSEIIKFTIISHCQFNTITPTFKCKLDAYRTPGTNYYDVPSLFHTDILTHAHTHFWMNSRFNEYRRQMKCSRKVDITWLIEPSRLHTKRLHTKMRQGQNSRRWKITVSLR